MPLLLGLLAGWLPKLTLPGALMDIVARIVLGPSALGWVTSDSTVKAALAATAGPGAGQDVSQFESVLIWCKRFSVGFGVAGLAQ